MMSPQNLNSSLLGNRDSFNKMPKKRKPSVRKNRKTTDINNMSNYDIVSDMPEDPRFMVKQLQNNYMDALRAEIEATKNPAPRPRGMKTGMTTKVNPSLL